MCCDTFIEWEWWPTPPGQRVLRSLLAISWLSLATLLVGLLAPADWTKVEGCLSPAPALHNVSNTTQGGDGLDGFSWEAMGTAFVEGFEQLFFYNQPGDIICPDLTARPGVEPESMQTCLRIGVSLMNWWLISLHRDAFGLGLAYCVILWLRHALGQAASHEKREVETILEEMAATGTELSSGEEEAETDMYRRHRGRRRYERRREPPRDGEIWWLRAIGSVNDLDEHGPQHHIVTLGMELGGPLPVALQAGAVLVATELVWPSMVSTLAEFLFGQPLLLVLLFAQDLITSMIESPSGVPPRCFRRRCVMAMVFGFVVLPAAQALLFGQGMGGLQEVIAVDWLGFACIVYIAIDIIDQERLFLWSALFGLLLVCRSCFGTRGVFVSLLRASQDGLWWGTAVTVISAIYAAAVLVFSLGPAILCELTWLGWLSRIVVKTRNDLPRPVRTACLVVDSVISGFYQSSERESTMIHDITDNCEVAEICEVAMICSVLGFILSPVVFGVVAGGEGLRDPLRTSWLPASSIFM